MVRHKTVTNNLPPLVMSSGIRGNEAVTWCTCRLGEQPTDIDAALLRKIAAQQLQKHEIGKPRTGRNGSRNGGRRLPYKLFDQLLQPADSRLACAQMDDRRKTVDKETAAFGREFEMAPEIEQVAAFTQMREVGSPLVEYDQRIRWRQSGIARDRKGRLRGQQEDVAIIQMEQIGKAIDSDKTRAMGNGKELDLLRRRETDGPCAPGRKAAGVDDARFDQRQDRERSLELRPRVRTSISFVKLTRAGRTVSRCSVFARAI